MFIPVYDQNPLRSIRFQAVTVSLILINIFVFILEVTTLPQQVIFGFALIPSDLLGAGAVGQGGFAGPNQIAIPERLTLLSYMFFHGDILHLAGNMVFLWVFGDNVEDALGHFRFLIFYLACGAIAGLVHALMLPSSEAPLIGASGAVAGVVAAYLMLHPKVRVWILILRFIPIQISAAFALGAWILTQFVMVLVPETGPVAWWAHVGGILAGAVLVLFMRRPGVPLFDRGIA
ncbi:MAG: rhomboid family intramembrane serine protease [Proteobacteria bacterium]|nr:MAG: rhomboid family intramembrane serine protease [Pseudomonadota bacterium]